MNHCPFGFFRGMTWVLAETATPPPSLASFLKQQSAEPEAIDILLPHRKATSRIVEKRMQDATAPHWLMGISAPRYSFSTNPGLNVFVPYSCSCSASVRARRQLVEPSSLSEIDLQNLSHEPLKTSVP